MILLSRPSHLLICLKAFLHLMILPRAPPGLSHLKVHLHWHLIRSLYHLLIRLRSPPNLSRLACPIYLMFQMNLPGQIRRPWNL
jgi:hypothetical protein